MHKAALFLLLPFALYAQTPSARLIRVSGQGSVSITPDKLTINVGVSTTAATAQDAASQNASQSSAVIAQVTRTLGSSGSVRTVSYSLTPNYKYSQSAPPVLTGYTATNTVEVTATNTSLAGPIIDAANQAGANNIGSLRFGLRDDSIPRAQALIAAVKQARGHADAIATGLNARVGNVVTAQESVAYPLPLERTVTGAPGATTAPTPVETGTLTVTATVTVDYEIVL